ncbi:MAG: hypothetical protein ACKN89_04810 [Cyanobium sp.]|nr:hypothetical protein [Synechococcaceae cyanobacterium]
MGVFRATTLATTEPALSRDPPRRFPVAVRTVAPEPQARHLSSFRDPVVHDRQPLQLPPTPAA